MMKLTIAGTLLLMTICGSGGGFFLKKCAVSIGAFKTVFLNKYFYLGGLFYCAGSALNIVLLKYIPYNLILPLNSLTYIWTLLLAHFWLKEKITHTKVMGILLIVTGVIFVFC
jgi:drug/metabolite transporter (DMT)-like permease